MAVSLPEPAPTGAGPKGLFVDYLDYYRATIAAKLTGLDETQLRTSRLPSGWTPLELLKHLVYMERRWLLWGFAAEAVDTPWGDASAAGRWHVDSSESLTGLLGQLRETGRTTRQIVESSELTDVSAVGGRFLSTEEAPPLSWILFHVLQEYARHAGHLDIVRELVDGSTGE